MNKEADHLQITALTRALSVHTRIAYLDQSGAPPGGFGFGDGDGADAKVDFIEFEDQSEERLEGALLYRELLCLRLVTRVGVTNHEDER